MNKFHAISTENKENDAPIPDLPCGDRTAAADWQQLPDDLLNKPGFLDQNLLWGAVASGYCAYGWKQRSLIPFPGGLVMTVMSFIGPNALVMSLVSLAAMFAVWWLMKQGY